MASISQLGASNVYRFPSRSRPSQPVAREGEGSVAELFGPPLARMEFGSAWYHEAAMQEEADEERRDQH